MLVIGAGRRKVIKYADDQVLLESSEEDLQKVRSRIVVIGKSLEQINAIKLK